MRVLLANNVVTGATMAFRGAFKKVVIPFAEHPGPVMIHDGWIAVMIAAVSKIAMIQEPLLWYRQHGQQQFGAVLKDRRINRIMKQLLDSTRTYRRSGCWGEIARIELVRDALIQRQAAYDPALLIEEFDKRISHINTRGTLPTGRLARIPRVLTELLALRYHHFSRGFISAAKDLLI